MDMGPAFAKAFADRTPDTQIALDPFHVVKLGTEALEEVRCDLWRQLRKLPTPDYARRFVSARWALLKNPGDLTQRQNETLRQIKSTAAILLKPLEMKESLRGIFGSGLSNDEVAEFLDSWCARASRSQIPSFVRLSKTIRIHKAGIMAAIEPPSLKRVSPMEGLRV
ncbi:transposase [Acidithrix sp. C25]|uniref:transposase n=1 Tax=Acidithrix sp. C25 TaxID=1671482 RepID=UPI001BC7C29A|nr:transposase [Acidithrix sp. C25]CAG4922094.1 unnamed protein product [Acidithrix sp. C25]